MALVTAIVMLLILAILTPALVFLVQNESRMTLKQKRSTNAYYAAEAAVDRALWMLRASSSAYNSITDDGVVPAGYKLDRIYTDSGQGAYMIGLSSTITQKEVRVEAFGRDEKAAEFRRIEVLLRKDAIAAAIYAPNITSAGSSKIFWGPLMSQSAIVLQGSSNELFPRKFARGAITSTGGGYADRDSNSSAPNTDGLEWWSYNEPPGVPDPPAVDLDYYRAQAKAMTGCPAGGTSCTPAGNTTCCYYTTNQNFDNLKSTYNKVYFFEQDAKFTGSKHFRGWLIVMDEIEMTGSGESGATYGEYTPTIPLTAYKEYLKNTPKGGDNCLSIGGLDCGGGSYGQDDDGDYDNHDKAERDDACCHQYPGDRGLASTETYTFGSGCVAHGNDGGAPTEKISFKGFIYVNGNSKISGSASIHGSLLSASGAFTGSGSFSMFYDDSVDVKMTNSNFTVTSWMELIGKSF